MKKKILLILGLFLAPSLAYAGYTYDVVSVISDAITTDLIPATTNTYNIGSPTKEWANLYVRNATISTGTTASGTTNIIGTSTNAVLAVTQGGTGPVATFMGGNVGIGTTNPSTKLEVNGTSIFHGTMDLNTDNTGLQFGAGDAKIYETGQDLYLQTWSGSALITRLFIDNGANGNVGIGTTTPQSLLSVGSVNNGTSKYLQIDSEHGAPADDDCDSDLERGRQIHDYTNFRLYVCGGKARGWDYISLTD